MLFPTATALSYRCLGLSLSLLLTPYQIAVRYSVRVQTRILAGVVTEKKIAREEQDVHPSCLGRYTLSNRILSIASNWRSLLNTKKRLRSNIHRTKRGMRGQLGSGRVKGAHKESEGCGWGLRERDQD